MDLGYNFLIASTHPETSMTHSPLLQHCFVILVIKKEEIKSGLITSMRPLYVRRNL